MNCSTKSPQAQERKAQREASEIAKVRCPSWSAESISTAENFDVQNIGGQEVWKCNTSRYFDRLPLRVVQ